eukprot:gene24801-29966_t
MSHNSVLFEDTFDVNALNVAGKKFERVNRLHCKGTTYDVDLVVDINCELFDVKANDKVSVLLASSLNGAADDGHYKPSYGNNSLLDHYDYAMHGRVFLIKHIENQLVELQASFGGLLLRLRGEQALVEKFSMDMTLFILMKKGGSSSMEM